MASEQPQPLTSPEFPASDSVAQSTEAGEYIHDRGVNIYIPEIDVRHIEPVAPQAAGADRVYLAQPFGPCGGVRMANQVLSALSDKFPGRVVGNHVPVHNIDFAAEHTARGIEFDVSPEQLEPETVYFLSAHGTAPAVIETARSRGADIYNSVCPLVEHTFSTIREAGTKEASVVYISFGSEQHPEVRGAVGEAEAAEVPIRIIHNLEDIEAVFQDELIRGRDKVVVVSQTTNNADEASQLARAVRTYAADNLPQTQVVFNDKDVCRTVRDRQSSVVELVERGVDVVVVVGSVNSKNTHSLTKTAAKSAQRLLEAGLRDRPLSICQVNSWTQLPHLEGTVGVCSGASAPTPNVEGIVEYLNPTGEVELVGKDSDRNRVFRPVDPKLREVMNERRR